jgi:hypothetical protein
MDDYGNETRLALLEQRVGAVEAAWAASNAEILAELKLLRQELSEARGGLRFGKWLAGILIACAGAGAAVYQVWR